jgi:wobble nucleotide-excising tRNase
MKDKVKRMHLRRLSSDGAEFNVIEKAEDDIKTCYQGLWLDLRSIYECQEISPRLLSNPMRRIIETYVKFEGISKKDFYDRAPAGLEKFLNDNQHGLDDLEYEVGCKDKGTLMQLSKEAFKNNEVEAHFAWYWEFANRKSGKEQKHSD